MTAAESSNLNETRHDLEQTRAELGETVAALAAKTDVKARLRGKATTTAGGLRQRIAHASRSTKTKATHLIGTVSQKASDGAKPVKQKAQKTTTSVRDAAEASARTAGRAESTFVTTARRTTTKISRSLRGKPVPALAAAGTAATLAIVVYRRNRTR